MTIENEIIKIFIKEQHPFLLLDDFYQQLPIYQKSSISSALSRGIDKGVFERVERGVYFYDLKRWRLFRHAKRIYDTHSNEPQREFDLDLELTCQGYAPIEMSIDDIENIVNPRLLKRSLEILEVKGIMLKENIIDFRVIGSEWKEATIKEFTNYWDVEVIMINNVGSTYTFNAEFYVQEKEWKK